MAVEALCLISELASGYQGGGLGVGGAVKYAWRGLMDGSC